MSKTKAKPKPAAKPKAAPAAPPAEVRAPAPPPHGQVARPGVLPIDSIRPSPTNPRKSFPEESLAALADSIRSVGVRQRLLVRPVAETGHPAPRYDDQTGQWVGIAYFELIAGERRIRAAKLAGFDRVPVDVCDLTDDEVLLIQLVENDQREDVKPSEQAAAYRRLADAGRTAEQIAADTGKPLSFVRGLLRLGKLPAWALAEVDAGTLPRATAELIARVPSEQGRKRCAAYVTCGAMRDSHGDAWAARAIEQIEASGSVGCASPLSYRDTKDLIRNHFTVELKGAPFDRKSLDLLPEAGSCEACPKRAGNDPEATAEGTRADVCLDPDCYRAKIAANRTAEVAKAAAKGIEEADIDTEWNDAPPRDWCRVDRVPGATPLLSERFAGSKLPQEKLTQLLGKDVPRYIAFDARGNSVSVVKTADAKKALVAAGVIRKPEQRPKAEKKPPTKTTPSASDKSAKAGPTKLQLDERTALVAADRARTMLLANAESLAALSENGGPDTDAVYQALSFAARVLVYDWLEYGNDRRDAVVRLLPTANTLNKDKDRAAADKAVNSMTPAEIVGLILGLIAHTAVSNAIHWGDDIVTELLDYADTTEADCEEAARRELTAPVHPAPQTPVVEVKPVATQSATRLSDIDNFPDAVSDALAPGITTLPTLLERVEAESGSLSGMPLRTRVSSWLVRQGVKAKQAENAAAAVSAHVEKNGKAAAEVIAAKPAPIVATTCVKCKAAFDIAKKKCPSCNWVQPTAPTSTATAGSPQPHLRLVPAFPSESANHLAAKGVQTIADLDAKLAELQSQRGRANASRYDVMKELDTPHVYDAGDALVDYETKQQIAADEANKGKKGAKAK